MNPIERPSGSGNGPKFVRPGVYVLGITRNLACSFCNSVQQPVLWQRAGIKLLSIHRTGCQTLQQSFSTPNPICLTCDYFLLILMPKTEFVVGWGTLPCCVTWHDQETGNPDGCLQSPTAKKAILHADDREDYHYHYTKALVTFRSPKMVRKRSRVVFTFCMGSPARIPPDPEAPRLQAI
jgi:hypothetical protein